MSVNSYNKEPIEFIVSISFIFARVTGPFGDVLEAAIHLSCGRYSG